MTEKRWPLPPSWEWASIKDIAEVVGGGTPDTKDAANFTNDGISWLTPADLTGYRDTYISRGARDLSEKGYKNSSAKLMPPGTVLFSSRAPIGYCAIASNKISTNQGFKSFVLEHGLSPEYLRNYLIASIDYARSKASGTTFQELSGSRAAELAVPIAPFPEQQWVAAKIDSLSKKSQCARDQLEHIPRLAEKYRQAILAMEFERAAEGSAPVAFSEAIASTFYGPRFAKAAYESGGIITLRTTDFDDYGNVKLKAPPSVRVSDNDFAKWGLVDGDLLVTRTGSIGKCALYTDAIGPALPSAYLIRVRLKIERIRPRYALLFLLSKSGQEQLGLGITAVTQPNINAGVIERLCLSIPSIASQNLALRRIDAAFAWIDRLASETATARKLIDHLDQAVLAKAFRGELVPQDPNDEPASVLLERIRVERQSASAPPRQKGLQKTNKRKTKKH